MAPTKRDRQKLLSRINRLKGQLESAAKKIEKGDDCYRVMQVLASCRGALSGLMGDMIDGHVKMHVVQAKTKRAASHGGREVTEILRSFWK